MAGIPLTPQQRSALAQALLSRGLETPRRTTSPWQNIGRVLNVIAGQQQMAAANQQDQQEQGQLAEAIANAAGIQGANPRDMRVQNEAGQFTVNTPGGGMSEEGLVNQQLSQGGRLAAPLMQQLNLGKMQARQQAQAEAEAARRTSMLKMAEGDYGSERDFREAQALKVLDAKLRDPKDTFTQLDQSQYADYKLPPNTIFAQVNDRSGKVEAKTDSGFEFEISPDGTVRASSGSRIGRRSDATQVKLQESFDFYDSAVNDLDDVITKVQADQTLLGTVGAFRKFGQSVFGISSDISRVLGVDVIRRVIGDVEDRYGITENSFEDPNQKKKFFDDPNLSTMRLFENHVGFMLARQRQKTGRILASTIEQAMKDSRLTGLTSAEDAFNRLQMIREMMAQSRDNYAVQLAGGERKPTREVYNEATGELEVVE